MSGFKINFSAEDKSSEARGFEALPGGKYKFNITDVSLATVNSGANEGKPYMKLELTMAEGEQFTGRKVWSNIMLFQLPAGNWFLAQFLKATGNADALETGEVPDIETFIGKQVTCIITKKLDKYAMDRSNDNEPIYRNDVSGFISDTDEESVPAKGRARKNPLAP